MRLDPENSFPPDFRTKFQELHDKYDEVFNPQIPGYNDAAGSFEGKINMGHVEPPERKGRLPQYARNRLAELQDKFEKLENLGVLKYPQDVPVSVEYVNASSLITKSSGGFFLVTVFADVRRYSKPQPSLMADVDSTLRYIA